MSDNLLSGEATPAAAPAEPATESQEVASAPIAPSNFLDSLPDDLKGEKCLHDFKDLTGLAKSYVNAQKMIGNSVRIPGEDAGEEQLSDFYEKLTKVPGVMRTPNPDDPDSLNDFLNKIGRPETPDGYRLDIPDGLDIEKEQLGSFLQDAHKIGLTNSQTNHLLQKQLGAEAKAQEAFQAKSEEAIKTLKEAWGSDFDTRLKGAQELASMYEEQYGTDMSELIAQAGTNPALVQILADQAKTFTEQGVMKGSQKLNYGVTPSEARAQIDEIKGNRNHAYYDPNSPGHEAAQQKMTKLYEIAYGEQG